MSEYYVRSSYLLCVYLGMLCARIMVSLYVCKHSCVCMCTYGEVGSGVDKALASKPNGKPVRYLCCAADFLQSTPLIGTCI